MRVVVNVSRRYRLGLKDRVSHGWFSEDAATAKKKAAAPGAPSFTELEREQAELDARKQRLMMERQLTDQEVMLKCVTEQIDFKAGRPVAACIIFRSLLHWRSFEADRTNVFDRIIQTMSRSIEHKSEDTQVCCSGSLG